MLGRLYTLTFIGAIGIASLLFIASEATRPTTRITFYNRTEVTLELTIDESPVCSAKSFDKCEAVALLGPHKLGASFHGKALVTTIRDAKLKAKQIFSICHLSDSDPICQH